VAVAIFHFASNVTGCAVFDQDAGQLTDQVTAVSFFMKRISKTLLLGLTAGALCLTSCETVENRISEHQDMFNTLSRRDQALVRQGQIRSGMSMNAVWLAWGSPAQKTYGEMRGRQTETWIYVESRTAPYGSAYYPYYGYGPGFYGGFGSVGVTRTRHHGRSFVFFGDPFYDPFYYSYIPPTISIPYRTVTFSSGRVMSFQYLAPPYR
jgi:outer membrane protein assembly factor BamE (lipoprotein component of BamABCDE complex)